MQKRRGISPILATVLLIGFSIAMAALVTNVLVKQAKKFNPEEQTKESSYCDQVSFSLEKAKDANGVVQPTETKPIDDTCNALYNFKYRNKGSFSIHRFTLTAPLGLQKTKQSLEYPVVQNLKLPTATDFTKQLDPSYIEANGLLPGKLSTGIILYCGNDDTEVSFYPWILNPDTKELAPCPSRTLTTTIKTINGVSNP